MKCNNGFSDCQSWLLCIFNKTLWKRILGRRYIRHFGMHIYWESECTSVQDLMIGSTEYWDSLVCG